MMNNSVPSPFAFSSDPSASTTAAKVRWSKTESPRNLGVVACSSSLEIALEFEVSGVKGEEHTLMLVTAANGKASTQTLGRPIANGVGVFRALHATDTYRPGMNKFQYLLVLRKGSSIESTATFTVTFMVASTTVI